MFTVSIIWIVILLILIVIAKKQQKVSIKYSIGSSFKQRRLSSANKSSYEAEHVLKNFKLLPSKSLHKIIEEEVLELDKIEPGSKTAIASSSIFDLSKFHFTYDYENGTGELYMRYLIL